MGEGLAAVFRFVAALSVWAAVVAESGGGEGNDAGAPRGASSEQAPVAGARPNVPRNKKGLGGFGMHRGPVSDLAELGVSSVTVNVKLGFLHGSPGDGRVEHRYGGKSYYVDTAAIGWLDQTLLATAGADQIVFAILLVPRPDELSGDNRGMAHPDFDGGYFPMPNVTDPEGVGLYGAALDYLAERYGTPGGRHGRIHHWIVHNEVDAGTTWTNAGKKTLQEFMDLYHRSLRLVHQIAHRRDPASRAYISLTHSWAEAEPSGDYPGRDVLEELIRVSHGAGDFDWGIAYHPYPHSLFDPRIWADPEAKHDPDSPMVTMQNLEVLVAWARRPENRFEGRVRSIVLSEQGFHSADYGEEALKTQAAAMAYTWKKLAAYPEVECFHYHNWIDNRGEGGLRIGLRRFGDDAEDPLGRKPIWHVYRALGTAEEEAACRFALPIVGVEEWSGLEADPAGLLEAR